MADVVLAAAPCHSEPASEPQQMLERKPRLFIGIVMDEPARERCAQVAERLRAARPNLRLVEPENYHLTLAFLGNIRCARIPEIEAYLADVAARHERFEITFNRVGAFPHERKPRIIFIGSRGADSRYRALAADVRKSCARLGFAADEKDDIPHVTIARAPDRKHVSLPLLDVAPISITANGLTLFESVPHEGRTRYLAVAQLRLATPAPPRPSGA
jgi:RNA 2',3'-cyclic 3'-phosphodiesterase